MSDISQFNFQEHEVRIVLDDKQYCTGMVKHHLILDSLGETL